MTSHRYFRCQHCQAPFIYQTSGQRVDWYGAQLSRSADYCKTCFEAVTAALAPIPVRCVKFFEPVDEETTAKVLAKREHDVANPTPSPPSSLFFGLRLRAVSDATFRVEDGRVTDTCRHHHVELDGTRYTLAVWDKGFQLPEAKRHMERDVQTDKTRPWKDYAR